MTLNKKECLICNRIGDEPLLEVKTQQGFILKAHESCIKGFQLLLNSVKKGVQKPNIESSVVQKVGDEWIVLYRNYPNQYLPILLYFSLYHEEPMTILDLKGWLKKNRIKFSNPKVPLSRLCDKGSLAVYEDDDGNTRYFITEVGQRELDEFLSSLKL